MYDKYRHVQETEPQTWLHLKLKSLEITKEFRETLEPILEFVMKYKNQLISFIFGYILAFHGIDIIFGTMNLPFKIVGIIRGATMLQKRILAIVSIVLIYDRFMLGNLANLVR